MSKKITREEIKQMEKYANRPATVVKDNGYDGYVEMRERGNVGETDMPVNRYYLRTAYKIKLARWLAVLLLAAIIGAGLIFNSRELTAGNLNYLLRYINRQGAGGTVSSGFHAEIDESSSLCYYRNGIAILRKNRIDIYDINGRRNFTSRLIYSAPVMKASDRYIITYDLGMNKMEIFNNYSRVYEYKGDGPVYGAQVTGRGNVVYITSEPGYESVVYVMDNGFNDIFKCKFGEDFVVSADIDDRAERLAVAGFTARDGDYLSRISMYETKTEEPLNQIEIIGEQPYGVKLTETGVFAIFENSFRIYDCGGSGILNYDFAFRKIRAMSLTPKLAAVVLDEKTLGTDCRMLIFDEAGNILYDNIIGAEIRDIQFSEDYKILYFLTRTGLYKINIDHATFEFVTNEYDETTNNIIYANDKNIFLSGLVKINIAEVN